MMVITVYSVTLTWRHVVLVLRVFIVETGISLMKLDCHSLEVVILLRLVELNKLTYVVTTMLCHHLVYIAVIFQLIRSMRERQSMLDCMPLEVKQIYL